MRSEREYDDTTLAHKVESEIFRPADAPQDRLSVNVADGVVELRGEVKRPEQIELLTAGARIYFDLERKVLMFGNKAIAT